MPGAAAAPRAPSWGGERGESTASGEKGSEGYTEREYRLNKGKKGEMEQSVKDEKAGERRKWGDQGSGGEEQKPHGSTWHRGEFKVN